MLAPCLMLVGQILAADPAKSVASAVDKGDCDAALMAASEAVAASPADPTVVRLLGDAWMCNSNTRGVVAGYRRAVSLGLDDAGIKGLVSANEKLYSTLEVEVTGIKAGAAPTVTVVDPELGELQGYDAKESRGRFTATFYDLAPGSTVKIRVGGLGYVLTESEATAGGAGKAAKARPGANYQGVGALDLAAWPEAFSVVMKYDDGQEQPVQPGEVALTGGKLDMVMSGPTGTVAQRVKVTVGQTVAVAVPELLPAQIDLSGLPEGSRVILADGPSAKDFQPVEVPRGEGDVDGSIGMGLTTRSVSGLKPGTYVLTVTNPVLGEITGPVDLLPGQAIPLAVPWRTASKADQALTAYANWKAVVAQAGPGRGVGYLGAALAVGGAGALGYGGYLWATHKDAYDKADTDFVKAVADGDTDLAQDIQPTLITERAFVQLGYAYGAAGLVVGAGGGVLAFRGFRGGDGKKDLPAWDPYSAGTLPQSAPEGAAP